MMVLTGLQMITFEEDEDDDEWGHALSAACCLQKLSILLGNHVLAPVVQFVAANIQ
jgi:importin subunit beta-1